MMLKGIAICMMMLHHCFLKGRFEEFGISLWPFSHAQMLDLAALCKICVSMFCFISGYGLFLSYKRNAAGRGKRPAGWIAIHWLSSFHEYFFVVVLAWILTFVADGRPKVVYMKDGLAGGIANAVCDLLGVSSMMGTKTINGTWWYMSAALVFIILTPFVCELALRMDAFSLLLLALIVPRLVLGGYPGSTSVWSFLPAYMCGAAFAAYDPVLKKLKNRIKRSRKRRAAAILILGVLLVLCSLAYLALPTKLYWDLKWGLFPVLFICFCLAVIRPGSPAYRIFGFLGVYSPLIFMIHSFYRHYYLNGFIYGFPHFTLVILVLLGLSLATAVLVRLLIRLTRYDRLIRVLKQKL